MDYRSRYEAWLNDPLIEEKDREELKSIASDEKDGTRLKHYDCACHA
jgi:phosphoglucomutase